MSVALPLEKLAKVICLIKIREREKRWNLHEYSILQRTQFCKGVNAGLGAFITIYYSGTLVECRTFSISKELNRDTLPNNS